MPAGSGSKRERQYEDVKDGTRDEGGKRAKGAAAHTAGGERARGGGAKPSGGSSRGTPARDASSSKPGEQRSRGGGSGGATYDELYAEARKRDIPGRSSMNKAELQRKLGR